MPELPETETIARDLDREVAERASSSVASSDAGRAARGRRAQFVAARHGHDDRALLAARQARRARLSSGDRIVVQPRFTGALLIDDGTLAARPSAATRRSSSRSTTAASLHYRDIRRLGTVTLMTPSDSTQYVGALGIEPLDPAFTAEHLSVLLRGSRQAIKKVLMDQRAIAGIGNIYANEALWRAGIDPSRAADVVDDRRGRRACATRSSTC